MKTGTLPHGISKFAVLQKPETSKTGTTLPHGISGVAVHVDQHTDKNCLIHVQLYLQQRINNLKAFSSVELAIQQNTNGLLTVSSTFFVSER